MSRRLAVSAFGIVALGLVISTVAGRFGVSDKLAALIPVRIREFFERPIHVEPVQIREKVGQTAREIAPAPQTPTGDSRAFTLGASEADVIRIQGRPTRVAGSTWFYGDSEVNFIAGRVVSWKESSRNPLSVSR